MAKIVSLDSEVVDFENAVEEVDILVPKYLECLEQLGKAETIEDASGRLQGVAVYWERLQLLFRQMQPLEAEVPFEDIIRSTLQSELVVLEQIYLKINLRLQLIESEWSDELFKVAYEVLMRMDRVLEDLGFPIEHEDRLFITTVLAENEHKLQRWLLRRHADAES